MSKRGTVIQILSKADVGLRDVSRELVCFLKKINAKLSEFKFLIFRKFDDFHVCGILFMWIFF